MEDRGGGGKTQTKSDDVKVETKKQRKKKIIKNN